MNLTDLAKALETETALIRTDRSDDLAWAKIREAIATPVDTTDSGDPEDFWAPNVGTLDDPAYEGATGEVLAAAIAAAGNEPVGYALLADTQAMAEAISGGALTLAYVDLSCPDPEDAELFNTFMGRTFRCVVPEIAAIEVNLSLGNMDFHEFADYADERGGVFRGFDSDD